MASCHLDLVASILNYLDRNFIPCFTSAQTESYTNSHKELDKVKGCKMLKIYSKRLV